MPVMKSMQALSGPVTVITAAERQARQPAENQKLLNGQIGVCYTCFPPRRVAFSGNLLKDVNPCNMRTTTHTHQIKTLHDELLQCRVGRCDVPLHFVRMMNGPDQGKNIPLNRRNKIHACTI